MKKTIFPVLCAFIACVLFGCSAQTADKTVQQTVTQDSKQPVTQDSKQPEEKTADPTAAPKDKEIVNLDLTLLSGTMVYAEVYDMMYHPENYMGKKIRMNGTYTLFHDDNTGKDYHGCIVKDATACCAQGIEFELTDDYSYPDDYPAEGGQICIVGVFDTYNEGANTYCILKGAKIERM